MKKLVFILPIIVAFLFVSNANAQKGFPDDPVQGYNDTGIGKGDLLQVFNPSVFGLPSTLKPFTVLGDYIFEVVIDTSRIRFHDKRNPNQAGEFISLSPIMQGGRDFSDIDAAHGNLIVSTFKNSTSNDFSDLAIIDTGAVAFTQVFPDSAFGNLVQHRFIASDPIGDLYSYDIRNQRVIRYLYSEVEEEYSAFSEIDVSSLVAQLSVVKDMGAYEGSIFLIGGQNEDAIAKANQSGQITDQLILSTLTNLLPPNIKLNRIFVEDNGRIIVSTVDSETAPGKLDQYLLFLTPDLDVIDVFQLQESGDRGDYQNISQIAVDEEANVYIGELETRQIKKLEYINHAPTALDPNRTRYEYDLANTYDYENLFPNYFNFEDRWNSGDEFGGIRVVGVSGNGILRFDNGGNGVVDTEIVNGSTYDVTKQVMDNYDFIFDGDAVDSLAELNYFEFYYQWMDKAGAVSQEVDTIRFNSYKSYFEFDGVDGKDAWHLMSVFVDSVSFEDYLDDFNLISNEGGDDKIRFKALIDSSLFIYDSENEELSPVTDLSQNLYRGDAFIIKIAEDEDTTTAGIQGGWPKQEYLNELETGYFDGSEYVIRREVKDFSTSLNYNTNLTNPKYQGYNITGNPFGQSWVWDPQNMSLNNVSQDIAVWDPLANNGDGGWSYPTYPNIQEAVTIKPGEAFVAIANSAQNELGFSYDGRITDQVSPFVNNLKVETISTATFTMNKDGYESSAFVRESGKAGARNIKKLPVFSGSFHEIFVKDTLNPEILYFATVNDFDTSGIEIAFDVRSTEFDTARFEIETAFIPKQFDSVFVLQTLPDNSEIRHFENNGFYEIELIDDNGVNRPEGSLELVFKDKLIGVSNENTYDIPARVELSQNYPNPFNPSTVINYAVPKTGKVRLEVYDMLGKKVSTLVDERKTAGNYSVQFDATNLASGIYIYRIVTTQKTVSKKMTLIK
jgi:hypothetical protein